jgi:hypothetical protein
MERCCGGMVVKMSSISVLAVFSSILRFLSDFSGGR